MITAKTTTRPTAMPIKLMAAQIILSFVNLSSFLVSKIFPKFPTFPRFLLLFFFCFLRCALFAILTSSKLYCLYLIFICLDFNKRRRFYQAPPFSLILFYFKYLTRHFHQIQGLKVQEALEYPKIHLLHLLQQVPQALNHLNYCSTYQRSSEVQEL